VKKLGTLRQTKQGVDSFVSQNLIPSGRRHQIGRARTVLIKSNKQKQNQLQACTHRLIEAPYFYFVFLLREIRKDSA
jgi:hypothetical protein